MGWALATQSEAGKPLHSGISIPFDALPFNKEKYPVLSSIAPYYDTLLNPDQLALFITEWDMALHDPQYRARLEEWNVVRDLAVRCQAEQVYLRFIGD